MPDQAVTRQKTGLCVGPSPQIAPSPEKITMERAMARPPCAAEGYDPAHRRDLRNPAPAICRADE
ncbi:hypothetical protein FKP32DRAFT_1599198 [Trametes sanguinea]|nr:hypothetical protein FKP32DRAFT_1599198 [Trametes sanguinea]